MPYRQLPKKVVGERLQTSSALQLIYFGGRETTTRATLAVIGYTRCFWSQVTAYNCYSRPPSLHQTCFYQMELANPQCRCRCRCRCGRGRGCGCRCRCLDLDSVSSKVGEDIALLVWMTIYGGGSMIKSKTYIQYVQGVGVSWIAAWMCLATLLPQRPRGKRSSPLLFLGGMLRHRRSLPACGIGTASGDISST